MRFLQKVYKNDVSESKVCRKLMAQILLLNHFKVSVLTKLIKVFARLYK